MLGSLCRMKLKRMLPQMQHPLYFWGTRFHKYVIYDVWNPLAYSCASLLSFVYLNGWQKVEFDYPKFSSLVCKLTHYLSAQTIICLLQNDIWFFFIIEINSNCFVYSIFCLLPSVT